MRLFLIRHGESEANRLGFFAGQSDTPLTDVGHEQARRAVAFFHDIAVDTVISSDLTRAMDTARPTAEFFGLPVIPEPGMREVFAGDWEGMPFADLPKASPEQYHLWKTDIGNVAFPNGETIEEAAFRAQETIRKIAEQHPQETVVIASHGGIIRALLALWQCGNVQAMQHAAWAPNASVSEILCENGTFRVVRTGITEHLGDMVTELPKTI